MLQNLLFSNMDKFERILLSLIRQINKIISNKIFIVRKIIADF